MDEAKPPKNPHLIERVFEICFVLSILVGLGVWVWIYQHPHVATAPKAAVAPVPVTATKPNLALQLVTTGIEGPIAFGYIPGDDSRLYIAEQRGAIDIFKDGQFLTSPLLNIKNKVRNEGEMGLLGMAFDPDFKTNHYLYVYYSQPDMSSVVARYTVASDGNSADPATEKIILKQTQPFPNHKGGNITFGPDGMLYIGFGDGGSAGDPRGNGQNMGTLLGKIVRINVHAGDPYGVPPDNPFVSTAGAKPEIWEAGLRNPWRFSFDTSTGDLLIADVGQDKHEEVDIDTTHKGGLNFGWRCYEGTATFKLDGCKPAAAFTAPIATYDHAQNRCSITGGYVYRGNAIKGLNGRYVYADYCTGEIWTLGLEAGAQPELALFTHLNFSTFGVSNDGSIYVADRKFGTVYKLIQAN